MYLFYFEFFFFVCLLLLFAIIFVCSVSRHNYITVGWAWRIETNERSTKWCDLYICVEIDRFIDERWEFLCFFMILILSWFCFIDVDSSSHFLFLFQKLLKLLLVFVLSRFLSHDYFIYLFIAAIGSNRIGSDRIYKYRDIF